MEWSPGRMGYVYDHALHGMGTRNLCLQMCKARFYGVTYDHNRSAEGEVGTVSTV
jgi:hypothetical protein